MSISSARLLTAEEFWLSPLNGKQAELVRGEVESHSVPGARQGHIQVNIGALLLGWSQRQQHGWVGIGSGFVIARDPDTLRGPDIAFVRHDRIPSTGVPSAFRQLAPDLAVEVVSPEENAEKLHAKVSDYLAAGTAEVWTIYPAAREVTIHTPDGHSRTLGADQELTSPILAGFRCLVAEIFAA